MNRAAQIDINDPRMLDRLVDGELTEAQERAVIAQLNQMPDGWRRCALAFLEARCWQRAARQVQALSNEVGDPQPAVPAAPSPPKPRAAWWAPGASRWPGALALCALFLLAFGIGSFLPNPFLPNLREHSARQTEAPPAGAPNMQLVDNGQPKSSPGTGESYTTEEPLRSQDLLAGNLTLVDNTGSRLEVPVYDWNEEVADQLMYRSQPLSPEFVQQLKRHQVRSHRSYVPVRLQDGRHVVLPIDKVEIIPVGGTAY